MFSESGKTRIVIVPSNDSHVRNFRIPNVFIKLAICFFICFVLGVGFIIWKYSNNLVDENRLAKLERENHLLEGKLQNFEEKVGSLQNLMNQYVAYDEQIRVLIDLEEKNSDIRKVGIGGPSVPDTTFNLLTNLGSENADNLKKIDQDLDQLLREAKFQEHSFQGIITEIEKKQHLWDHTPSIRPMYQKYGALISGFGFRRDPFTGKMRMHEGLDFADRRGTPIISTADGTVSFTGRRGGYGLCVEIDHGYGYKTRYAHCSIMKVKEGENVNRGQIIGLVGSTGRSKGPHVHYEVHVAGKAVDPERYILPEVVTD